MKDRILLAVALDGAGWHPAAWRDERARPTELFDAPYWTDLARAAERAAIDLLTIEDSLTLQSANPFRPDSRTDQVRGRLDAALLATRLAPPTKHIGLVPTITTTHTEPFHVANRISSLDHVSGGRAGWRVQVLRQHAEVAHFGRRDLDALTAPVETRFTEAADAVEVARRLWDSWEDDAEIRDRATGRFVDRDKLHYVDFEGEHFSVRGPSITPRPPQGQPVVVVLAHVPVAYQLAATSADVVLITPHDAGEVTSITAEVRAAEAAVDRPGPPLLVLADLLVLLEDEASSARAALDHLDELNGDGLRSDAEILTTTPTALAERLIAWHDLGLDGFRLRPARLPADLDAIVDGLVPELVARGRFPAGYDEGTLRSRLGLERPANRYAGRS